MKKNAQKILLCLFFFPGSPPVILSLQQLQLAVPEMTDSGFRSLVLFLEKKGWLIKERLPGRQFVSITDLGRNALKQRFPALNDKWRTWNGGWDCMVFIKAPANDQQFRYLRDLLIADHALPVSRGVYFSAGGFSSRVLQNCSDLYQDKVVIFSVGEWKLGIERPIVVSYYDLSSIATVYSSISTATDELLGIFKLSKRRTDQQKMAISTTIDRLWSGLREDPGFVTHYFPGVPDVASALLKIQQIILLWV